MTMTVGLFRLGADAELRHTQDGTPVCNLSLAFKYGRDDEGNRQTGWISAAFWGERAANACEYLTKGKEIMAYIADLHIESFTNAQGIPSSRLVGTLANFEFTAGSPKKPDAEAQAPAPAASNMNPPVPTPPPSKKPAAPRASSKKASPETPAPDSDFMM